MTTDAQRAELKRIIKEAREAYQESRRPIVTIDTIHKMRRVLRDLIDMVEG